MSKPRVEAGVQFVETGNLNNITNVFHAEALALANAVGIADQMGVGRVLFETDCDNLRNVVASSEQDFSSMGILVNDLKYQLLMNFIDARVVFTYKGM